jgi:hypothetical protein
MGQALTAWVATGDAAQSQLGRSMYIDLHTEPFTVAHARHVGLTWENLQARSWQRLARGQYAWSGLTLDVALRLRAAAQRLPSDHAFSGRTAAWLFGLDMPPCDPIEATVPRHSYVRRRAGIQLSRASLTDAEVLIHCGFRVTAGVRTVRDLGSRRDTIESVVAIDMALRAGLVEFAEVARWVESNSGAKGVKRFRRALSLANPLAESPMETRLRLALIAAGLPSPSAQVAVYDRDGDFLARADLYYPDVRLVIEYDGQHHKERLVEDLRRQNALVNSGYHVLRFTAPDLRLPAAVASQVRRARGRLLGRVA